MAEFKKISDVELVEAPAENDTLLLVSEGEVKQVLATNFAAASGGAGGAEPIYLINKSTSGYGSIYYTLEDGSPVPTDLYDLFVAGTPIYIQPFNQGGGIEDAWFVVIGGHKGPSYNTLAFYDFFESGGALGLFQC